jgi:glycerol-3-phosphate acyltransferase PlsY
VLAVMGHNWPVYLGFKGGKGVATSTGALVGLAPWCALAGFGVWLLVFLSTRYVSLASISAAVAICVLAWVTTMKDGFVLPLVLTLLAIILIWKHRENIGRLLRGNENRIELRKKKGLEGTP